MSEIQNFYKNKNVLLTGGTGFLGKMIIHKLLSTTEVNEIWVIIRPKKQVSVEERRKQIFNHKVFSSARHKIDQIKAVEGELTKRNLGLSQEDVDILSNKINVIFHCGASLNMGTTNIRETILSNIEATKSVIELARTFKHLRSLVYVSTAYSSCNCENLIIEERFYKTPIQSDLLISMAKEISDEKLQNVANVLKGNWPNFYTYSKAVSESLIEDVCNDIPAGIVRPSIVTSSVKEPAEGWTDNLYGPLGLILNINLGVLRVIYTDHSTRLDVVPADHVVNVILCSAWEIHERWNSPPYRPLILNCSGKDSSIFVDQHTLINCAKVALKSAIWYPFVLTTHHNPKLFLLADFIFHVIPYCIMDKVALMSGNKPFASRLFQKISKVRDVLYFFMVHEFKIQNENMYALWEKLGREDQQIYDFNVKALKKDEYFKSLGIGLKRFIVKEDVSEIRAPERKLKWLKILHYSTSGIILLLFALIIIMFVNFASAIL